MNDGLIPTTVALIIQDLLQRPDFRRWWTALDLDAKEEIIDTMRHSIRNMN